VAGSLYVTPMADLASVKAVEPKAGEVVVVSGASGGGLVAAQLAKRADATVIGLARSDNGGWLPDHGIIPVVYGDGQEGASARRPAASGSTRSSTRSAPATSTSRSRWACARSASTR